MVLSDPWEKYKNKKIFTNIKMNQTTLLCDTKNCKGWTQWALAPWADYKHKQAFTNMKM